ncbi:MAG TPA: PEP-CTERM sorting domain-containing protein [Steroidobacteraceae bacterium]|jgi:hypothetical protein|nr:PEP-CTERM sorting domain-containing protein [Steroidobacteraceae bacterium]
MSRKKIVAATLTLAAFGLGFAGFIQAMRANSNGQQADSGKSEYEYLNDEANRTNHPGHGARQLHVNTRQSNTAGSLDIEGPPSTDGEPQIGQCFDSARQALERALARGGEGGPNEVLAYASSPATAGGDKYSDYAGGSWGGFSGSAFIARGGSRHSGNGGTPGNGGDNTQHDAPGQASAGPDTPKDDPKKDDSKDESTPPAPGTSDPQVDPPPTKQADPEEPKPPTTTPTGPQIPPTVIDPPPSSDPPYFEPPPPGNGNDVHTVPEPGTLGLIALGAAALGLRRRRKASQQ